MTDQIHETSQLALDDDLPASLPVDVPGLEAQPANDCGVPEGPGSRADSSGGTKAFFTRTKSALQALHRAQEQRARHEAAAEERRARVEAEFRTAMAKAAAIEARAWQALLTIPGVTAQTAATLSGVSVATVHRRLKEARDV
jgi:hypothetical protein